MTLAKRTLLVQTERGESVSCTGVKVERTANPNTWLVLVEVAGWLDGGHDAHCTMRKGAPQVAPLFGDVQTTRGSMAPRNASIRRWTGWVTPRPTPRRLSGAMARRMTCGESVLSSRGQASGDRSETLP
jgi:hypothetical protein